MTHCSRNLGVSRWPRRGLLLTVILLVVLAALFSVMPALAFTPPTQSTDNATDTINWYGQTQNITISSANLTIAGLQTALTAASQAGAQVIADDMTDIALQVSALVLVILISALAFCKKDDFLYLLSVPVDMVYGLTYASVSTPKSAPWVIGLIVAIIGFYCLFYVIYKNLVGFIRRRRE